MRDDDAMTGVDERAFVPEIGDESLSHLDDLRQFAAFVEEQLD